LHVEVGRGPGGPRRGGRRCADEERGIPAGIDRCEVVAREGYRIRGTVRRADGKPPESVTLRVRRGDGSEVEEYVTWEAAEATFRSFRRLPAGE